MAEARGIPSGLMAGDDPREQRYYADFGRSCDWVLRCKDCRRLVTAETLQRLGACPCGNARYAEVTALSLWERFKIRMGLLRFPHWQEFLKDFRS